MEIVIANADITQVQADLVVMKHADGFYGADKVVADAIGFNGHIKDGDSLWIKARAIASPEVLFIGVGPLSELRYEKIQSFGSASVSLARSHNRPIRHLALTIHGPGYGLDPEQAFLSMLAGIIAEWTREPTSPLNKVTVVERAPKRCQLLSRLLHDQQSNFGLLRGTELHSVSLPEVARDRTNSKESADTNINQFGAKADHTPWLFVAMPFAEEFSDEYDIGFCEAAKMSDFLCRRLDLEHYAGDVVSEIKKKIVESRGVIALLNGHNPNVFFEIGFSLAHNKPTILVAKKGVKLPFDVSSQRCIIYRNIGHLRDELSKTIEALLSQGILGGVGGQGTTY
jgi:hypothetical protein